MSDDPKPQESGQEQASQELPVPKLENASAASTTSGLDTDALAKAILEKISPEIDKRVQSVKDKRIADIEKRLNSGQFAELEAMGAQIPENVKWEYRLRELEERSAQPSRKETSQGSGATLTAQDVSKVISDFALDANSPEVLEALRGTYRSRDHFEATMARLAIARASKPNPSPAAAPVGETGKTPSGNLQAEYQQEIQSIMKDTRAGEQRIRMLADLKMKYRAQGLNV